MQTTAASAARVDVDAADEATQAVSLHRFRRRRRAAAVAQAAVEGAAAVSPESGAPALVGTTLGLIERHYGLMTSQEAITIAEVVAVSGDLAVADRLAFVAAMERHQTLVVVEHEGWYVACTTERALQTSEVAALRVPEGGGPRIMSVVGERGITPALGPLCA